MRELFRRWWPALLGLVLGLGAGLLLHALQPVSYTATTTLFLGSPASVDSAGAYSGDLFSQQRASTYVSLVGNRDLAVKVIDDLGLSMTPEELSEKVSASQIPKTVLLDVSATDDSPQRAAEIANAYASTFVQYVARLETPAGAQIPSSVLTVVQQADTPESAATPSIWLFVGAGLALGLLAGLLTSWALRRTDRMVRTPAQLAEYSDAAVLGVLPRERTQNLAKLDIASRRESAYLEALRKLRTNLLYADVDNPPQAIAFVSPISSTSTTAIVANLAVVFDGIACKVAVVDADLREPRVAKYLGQHVESGLASVLASDVSVDDAVTRVSGTNIDYLAAGGPTGTASELLASDGLVKVVAELRNTHDYVFVDTPGLLAATDAAVIGMACDGVVVVAAQGKSTVEDMVATVEALHRIGARVLGAVLTESR